VTVAETAIPPSELTTSMVLTRALETLNATGWCKNEYTTKDGRHCIHGAILHVAESREQRLSASNAVLQQIDAPYGMAVWNDRDETIWADVQHVFNQAIKASTPKDENNGI
jgi:hypothetical protein